ncbi:chitin deacetylase, partial [Serendipita sp. 407]
EVHVAKRQAQPTPYPSGPAYDVPLLASITPTSVDYASNTLPVLATYTAGSQPPLSGAPPLPAYTIVPSEWPDLTLVPPTNSPQVQEWLKELEGHNIPNIPVNPSVDCGAAENAAALANAGANGQCWWSCGNCVRDTDISQCKDEWDWGHTYDDGPGFYTNKLLTYMNSLDSNSQADNAANVSPGVKATFFVVGARVISRPEIVVYEYMNNHEISGHTWSHSALTTLTNEQIVAELGWTRKSIRDVIGVTPLSFRPPYGDIDDRVRAIALAMGMRPVLWTSSMEGVAPGGSAIQWDSQDWRVHAGTVQSVPNQASFQAILDSSPQFSNQTSSSYSTSHQGVVVLQHDIYVESVNLAIGYTIPYAEAHQPRWNLKTVTECQPRFDGTGKQILRDAYLETNTDKGNPAYVAFMSGSDNNGTSYQTTVVTDGSVTRTVTRAIPSSSSSSGNGNSASGRVDLGPLKFIAGFVAMVFGGAILL